MLNETEKQFLLFIINECGDNYKVIEKNDFEDFCIQKFNRDNINVKSILKKLKLNNYILIKYSDDEKFCISATEEGKRIFDFELEEYNKNKKIKLRTITLLIIIFVLAFIGSFLGGCLSRIVV